MTQPDQELQSMIDRLDSQIRPEFKAQSDEIDQFVAGVTRSQMRQLKLARYAWFLGIVVIVLLPFAGLLRWYLAIVAVILWAAGWTFLTNKAIDLLGQARIKRGVTAILDKRHNS